jgi:hypothetical protein
MKLNKVDVFLILQDYVNEDKIEQETVDWIAEFIESLEQQIAQHIKWNEAHTKAVESEGGKI